MARFLQGGSRASGVVALLAGCLAAAIPASSQSFTPTPKPIFLDRKSASKLVANQEKPKYPPLAKLNYIQGRVRLQVWVTREGRVSGVHVIHGHPFLAVAALKSVRRWRYHPFKTESGAAGFLTIVDMKFALHTKKADLLPREAERDLHRQIRPPEILEKPVVDAMTTLVRLRVLVSDEGQALDSTPVVGFAPHFDAARKAVERWTFRPARWGALAVPWYLEVEGPVEDWPARRGANGSGGQ